MLLAIRRGERGDHRERGRDRGDPQPPRQAVTQRVDLLAHGAAVADDPARPIQHALALRREALESRAAVHQQHAHLLLELLHARGQRRLRHAAGLRCTAEVLFAGEGQDEFELVDHGEEKRFYLRDLTIIELPY